MKLKIVYFILIFCNTLFYSNILKLEDFFSQTDIKNLENNNIISRMYVKYNARNENTDELIKLPDSKYLSKYIPEDIYNQYSKYEIITDEKAFIPYDISISNNKLKFYNILLSYSKLSGMKYYSRRDKKVQEFIKYAYRIDPTTNKKIEDPQENEIKEYSTNYFVQKDNRLGILNFKSELYNDSDNFIMINKCLNSVSSGIIKINNKEEYLIVSIFIYNKEKKGFYYYTFQTLRFNIDFLLKNGSISPTTFSNRLRASTVHLASLLGIDWKDRLNPWKNRFDTY